MMKKVLLALLFLQIGISSFAQKIHFTDTSNTWNIQVTFDNASEVFTDHIAFHYNGTTNVNGVDYLMLGTYYVREDTAAKIVYVQNHDVNHGLVDTVDRVLYDYNLEVDDTVFSDQHFGKYKAWVSEVDSTRIDGIWYKVWHFTGSKDSGNGYVFYKVIEGLGCTNMFDYPVNTPAPEYSNQLVCFVNNGKNPELSKPVISYGMAFLSTMEFENKFNCPLAVTEITKNNASLLYPNPVTETSKVVLPYTVQSGSLSVVNYLGQVVSGSDLQNTGEVIIGGKVNTPGVYFYRITDNDNGNTFSGKFIIH